MSSAEIAMRREGSHLVPVDPVSAEMLAEIPTTKDLLVTVKVPRNLRQFRLAWALADIVAKSVDWLPDRESAMDWLKIKSRHVRMIQDPLRGTVAIVPKSISFASLDQTGFARLLNRMVYVTTTEIIPGLAEGTLRAELEAIAGIDTVPASEPETAKPPKAANRKKANVDPVSVAGGGETGTVGAEPPNTDAPTGGRLSPTNESEYVAAARSWLKNQTDRYAAFDWFNGERHRQMRLDLKISTGTRKQLEREIGEYFDEKDKAAAKAKGRVAGDNDRESGTANQLVD